jgi:hypothetical protein
LYHSQLEVNRCQCDLPCKNSATEFWAGIAESLALANGKDAISGIGFSEATPAWDNTNAEMENNSSTTVLVILACWSPFLGDKNGIK